MTDFRAPRRQPAETDFWWPEPDRAQRSARPRQPGTPDPRPALMQQRSQAPFPREQPAGRGGGARSRQPARPAGSGGRSRPAPPAARLDPPRASALALARTTPLTSFGVSAVLAGGCLLGGLLDLLLVSTAAWAITGLFLASSVYAAMKVHRSHWYSAVVGPPLAFAAGLLFVAQFSPERTGPGFMGTVTTILALLAIKARAAFAGTAFGLGIVLARRLPFNR